MTYNIAYIYHHKSEHQSVSTQTHIWINYLDVKAFTFYVFGFTIHRLEQVIFQVTTFSLSDLPSITINYQHLSNTSPQSLASLATRRPSHTHRARPRRRARRAWDLGVLTRSDGELDNSSDFNIKKYILIC
jgi:hypothetical protein